MNDSHVNNNDTIANYLVTEVHSFLVSIISWLHACYKFLDVAEQNMPGEQKGRLPFTLFNIVIVFHVGTCSYVTSLDLFVK